MASTGWLRSHSHLWGVLSMTMEHYHMWCRETEKKLQDFGIIKKKPNPAAAIATLEEQRIATEHLGKVAEALFEESKRECGSHHAKFAVTYLPGSFGKENKAEAEILRNSTTRLGIPYLDTNVNFRTIAKKEGWKPFFFSFHLSERGHKLVAEDLFDFLKNRTHVLPD